jgi:hypothetical protein
MLSYQIGNYVVNVALFTVFYVVYCLQVFGRIDECSHSLTRTTAGFNITATESLVIGENKVEQWQVISDTLGCGGVVPFSAACKCIERLLTVPGLVDNTTVTDAYRCMFSLDTGLHVDVLAHGAQICIYSYILMWHALSTFNAGLFVGDYWGLGNLAFVITVGFTVGMAEGSSAWIITAAIPAATTIFFFTTHARYVAFDMIFPLCLVILSVLQQQREAVYVYYTLLFGYGISISSASCKRLYVDWCANHAKHKSKESTISVNPNFIDAIGVVNVLAVVVYLCIHIPVLGAQEGMGFMYVRDYIWLAVVLVGIIPLSNTSVSMSRNDDILYFTQCGLEGSARIIITVAAILDMYRLQSS